MGRLISTVILLIVCTFYLNVTTGYKWESVKQGDKIPNNTIRLGNSKYVGRVFVYNLILPAEVVNSSYAIALNPSTKSEIETNQFEVLTASEKCEWKQLSYLTDVPENVVRVGRAWNREPIYLGSYDIREIASILLTSNLFQSHKIGVNRYALACAVNEKWVDATPPAVPLNAVALKKNSNYFAARLMGPYSLIPAYIQNDSFYCSTDYNGTQINSLTCQVLVENANSSEYIWKNHGKFERILENAIVVGRTGKNEFIYMGRNEITTLRLITFSEVVNSNYIYELLCRI